MIKNNTVAIIGGGVSGLSAAGLLSRNGYKVKLFEANEKLGGCCTTTNVGGYSFNDGAIYLALPGILNHVFEKLGVNRSSVLPLKKITASQAVTLPDRTVVTFGDGIDVTLIKGGKEIKVERLQEELNNLMKKWESVRRIFADDILLNPFSMYRFFTKGWRHIHKFRGTVAVEINKFFSNESVKAAMSGVLLYSGLPPEKIPVISMIGLASLFSEGFFLPEGGMGKIPEALSKTFLNNGGEIYLNSKINKIIVKNGQVCGIDVEGQGVIEVDAVISSISSLLTFDSLLDSNIVPEKIKRKVKKSPLSHKAFSVQLGLSNNISSCAHMNSFLPFMNEQYKIFSPVENQVKWPVYSVPTITMPELAPQGGSIIEMYPTINQNILVEEWDDDKKDIITEASINALSKIYKIDIAEKRILSPKDFQNRLHLYKGAVYGLSPIADPGMLFPYKTPVSGLYLAGQTTYPGYGVGPAAMSGILAAETLIRNNGK